MEGVKPFAPSLDTLGWFARSADDLELMRCALLRAAYVPLAVPAAASLRLGVCRTHEEPQLDGGGARAWHEAARIVSGSGVAVATLAMPDPLAGLVDAQKTVMAYEAARSLEPEWRTHRDRLSAALVSLLDAGRDIGEGTYRQALDIAARARPQVEGLMRDVDALLVPSAPGEAPRGLDATGDPVFSRVWTLLGLPCVNVPGLRGPAGMPVGVQLVGRAGEEQRLLCIAACLHRLLLQA
jgi:Asp-tRNA(Asn)/Glu-tRNA(Gln) amidotransferase A subunit family amidase